MARGVNKVILVGNLGRDPEVRFSANGQAIASFSIATSEQWKDKNTGDKKEKTEWHNITAFGRLAEICGEYLKKGSQVYVEGKLTTDKWQDKEGKDRYTTKVIVNEMQMLGTKAGNVGGGDYAGQSAPQQPSASAAPQPATQSAGADDFDDDIPF